MCLTNLKKVNSKRKYMYKIMKREENKLFTPYAEMELIVGEWVEAESKENTYSSKWFAWL